MSRDAYAGAADGPPAAASGRRAEDTRKRTQRQRILQGVVEIAARDGYEAATISQIIAHAGVSRPTFYDYFTDQEDCFLHATIAGDEQLVAHVKAAVDAEGSSRGTSALYAAIKALLEFCRSQPALARVLLNASLAAGSRALDERDKTIETIAEIVDDSDHGLATDSLVPDIASDVVVGAIYRVLGSMMRQGKPLDADLLADVIAWVESYEVPARARRWGTLRMRTPTAGASDIVVEPPFGAAPVAKRPRARTRNLEIYRQRLFFATSELVKEQGFGATTVAEITSRARVGYRSFSNLFGTKERAFLTMYDLGYRRVLGATARAYFSRETWPERVWAAGDAYTQYLSRHPTIAHFGFVETYSAGTRAAEQTDTAIKAFTIFLHEGHTHTRAGSHRPSALALDAIAATIFDLAAHETRTADSANMPALLPQAVFVALAPFLGPREAIEFIDRKLAEESRTPRALARSGS